MRRTTLAGGDRGELAIANSRRVNLRARAQPNFCKFYVLMRNVRPFLRATTKACISSRCLSAGRAFVLAAIVGRSILGESGVSAVNVLACSRRAAIRRIRARGMIYGKTRKSARGLYGSCLDSRVAPATSSIAHYQPCLLVPLLFLRRIKGLRSYASHTAHNCGGTRFTYCSARRDLI